MNFSIDKVLEPIQDAVSNIEKVADNVTSMQKRITADVIRNIPEIPDPSTMPKPSDVFNLTELIKRVGEDVRRVITSIPSLVSSVGSIQSNLEQVDFTSLSDVLKDTKNCDLPICNVINGMEQLLDLDNCNNTNCKLIREVRDVLANGNLASCDLYACSWLEQIIGAIDDPEGCDLEICKLVREYANIANLKKLLSGIAQSAIDSVKQPILMGLSAIVITIIVMFLMLLYLVFK